ncbi:hypothetical protein M231_06331 [Tremella mesenterica]|uniref:Uncharacterized protein n=1 Tax=Tremella mesenterica TaxID=5217 RepID=A0A4Q1BE09_TREME|nr:hypothetical protein M231_06331 [Tremella mesenterica]
MCNPLDGSVDLHNTDWDNLMSILAHTRDQDRMVDGLGFMGTTVDPRQLQTLPVPAALNDDTSDFDLDKWLEDDSSTVTPTLLSGPPTTRNATPGPSNIPINNELGTLQGDVGAVDFWSSMMGEGVSPTPSTNDVMSSDVGSIDGSHLSRATIIRHNRMAVIEEKGILRAFKCNHCSEDGYDCKQDGFRKMCYWCVRRGLRCSLKDEGREVYENPRRNPHREARVEGPPPEVLYLGTSHVVPASTPASYSASTSSAMPYLTVPYSPSIPPAIPQSPMYSPMSPPPAPQITRMQLSVYLAHLQEWDQAATARENNERAMRAHLIREMKTMMDQ